MIKKISKIKKEAAVSTAAAEQPEALAAWPRRRARRGLLGRQRRAREVAAGVVGFPSTPHHANSRRGKYNYWGARRGGGKGVGGRGEGAFARAAASVAAAGAG